MRLLIAFCLSALACGTTVAPAPAQEIDDQVYLLISSPCRAGAKAFAQTAFRTTVKGTIGLVTALHGVVGCQSYTARQQEGRIRIANLRLAFVDVARDVAFLVSDELARDNAPPLVGIPYTPDSDPPLTIVGHLAGGEGQLSHSGSLQTNPYRPLHNPLPPGVLAQLDRRGSPAVDVKVLWTAVTMSPGYSGAPVFVAGTRNVVGVADGGLLGGSFQANWAIPFMEIDWVDSAGVSAILEVLASLNTSDLFSSAYDSGPVPRDGAGATISGRILFAGRPVSAFSRRASAVIELMDVASRKLVPADVDYDLDTGAFEIRGVPEGKFTPFVRVETGYPFHAESGGDYFSRLSGLNPDIVVPPNQPYLASDLHVVHVIHLTRPVDNQTVRALTTDPPEPLYPSFYAPSAEVFAWDAVPGATYYMAYILTQERETARRLDTRSYRTTVPSISPGLSVSPPNAYYSFMVNAYDAGDRLIGVFINYYRNGSGGWFDFTVVPPPG